MTFVPVPTAHPQLAFGLGRRFGTAVERNRARRRLRAAFEAASASTRAPGAIEPEVAVPLGAYLLAADRAVLAAPFPTLVESIERCVAQVRDRAVGVVSSSTASTGSSTGSGPALPAGSPGQAPAAAGSLGGGRR